MGYRTVVVLINDKASEWESDPLLGRKIAEKMHAASSTNIERRTGPAAETNLGYGQVISCHHADTQTIGVFDGYGFAPIAHEHWCRGDNPAEVQLKLLKAAAKALGYSLRKNVTNE